MRRRKHHYSSRNLFDHNDTSIRSRLYMNVLTVNILNNAGVCVNDEIGQAMKIALEEIILPFRQGKFYEIKTQNYLKLLETFSKKKDECASHYLAMEAIAAAMYAKILYAQRELAYKENNKSKELIIHLRSELDETILELKRCNDDPSLVVTEFIIEATATLGNINLLKSISKINLFMAWHIYLFGMRGDGNYPPEDLLYTKNFVSSLGKNARIELLKRIE